jgi:beta-glucosidase
LKNQWKFKGYVTGDCGAVDDIYYTHKYTKSVGETVNATLFAGNDIDCGGFLKASNLKDALN